MNTVESRPFSWNRICLTASFVLLLLGAVFARASAVQVESVQAKALQQTLSEFKAASQGINSDPPESKSALPIVHATELSLVPRVLGAAHPDQHSPMVHQLRDRLMHAPPASL